MTRAGSAGAVSTSARQERKSGEHGTNSGKKSSSTGDLNEQQKQFKEQLEKERAAERLLHDENLSGYNYEASTTHRGEPPQPEPKNGKKGKSKEVMNSMNLNPAGSPSGEELIRKFKDLKVSSTPKESAGLDEIFAQLSSGGSGKKKFKSKNLSKGGQAASSSRDPSRGLSIDSSQVASGRDTSHRGRSSDFTDDQTPSKKQKTAEGTYKATKNGIHHHTTEQSEKMRKGDKKARKLERKRAQEEKRSKSIEADMARTAGGMLGDFFDERSKKIGMKSAGGKGKAPADLAPDRAGSKRAPRSIEDQKKQSDAEMGGAEAPKTAKGRKPAGGGGSGGEKPDRKYIGTPGGSEIPPRKVNKKRSQKKREPAGDPDDDGSDGDDSGDDESGGGGSDDSGSDDEDGSGQSEDERKFSRKACIKKRIDYTDFTVNDWRDEVKNMRRYLKEMSSSDLAQIFPPGLRTPAAILARMQGEIGIVMNGPLRSTDITRFILNNRDDEAYKAGKGHRRAVLTSFLALAASACNIKGVRELTPKMLNMVEHTFCKEWRVQLVYLLRNCCASIDGKVANPDVTVMVYRKGGEPVDILMHRRFVTPELESWIGAPWPKNYGQQANNSGDSSSFRRQ